VTALKSTEGQVDDDIKPDGAFSINCAALAIDVATLLTAACDKKGPREKFEIVSKALTQSNPENSLETVEALCNKDELKSLFTDTKGLDILMPTVN